MRILFQGPWQFLSGAWREHVLARPTTYRLRAWDPAMGKPLPIARACGVDAEGVLDIGTTGDGYRRLDNALRCMRSGQGSHAAGLKYREYDFARVFPLKCIMVEVVHLPSKEVAEAVELWLLEDYLYRHKDLPPLNSTAGNWGKVDRWLKSLERKPRRAGLIHLRGLLPGDCVKWPVRMRR